MRKGPFGKADKKLKRISKKWMNLPRRVSAELVFLRPYIKGGGLLPLADIANILTIVHAFKLLSCKNTSVANVHFAGDSV